MYLKKKKLPGKITEYTNAIILSNLWDLFSFLFSQYCWSKWKILYYITSQQSSSVQLLSCVLLFATPRTAARQASLSITNPQSLLKFMSAESVLPSNHLILFCPLLLPPQPFPASGSNESVLCIRWPKYWSFSFSMSPSNEYSGLISFRMNWLDLLAVQGTLESSPIPQFKSINSSALNFLYSPTLTSIHCYWNNHLNSILY